MPPQPRVPIRIRTRTAAGGVLDGSDAPDQVIGQLGRRQAQLKAVPVSVQRHLMAGGHDPRHQLRTALHLLTDHEERCPRAGAGQHLQHRRRPVGVGSVVERQRHPGRAGERPRKSQRVSGVSVKRCQGVADHASMMASALEMRKAP